MKIKPDFYRSIADEFVSKLGRLNNFTKHAPSIGTYHEEILKGALRSFLPRRYSLRTGFVFAETNKVSSQIDILIIDEGEPPSYFFQEGDFVVVHPDAVVCGIEVKTNLDKLAFANAVKNICSLREMVVYLSSAGSIGGMIFAYSGTKLSPEVTDRWYKGIKIPEDLTLYPNIIFVLDGGRIDLRPERDEPWGHYVVVGEEDAPYKVKSLSVFFSAIRKFAELKSGKESNPFSYADFSGQRWSKEYLRFGKGLITP